MVRAIYPSEASRHRPARTKEHIMKRLDNKVAIVTGASKGIGAGIAKAFGAEGAAVVVNYARDHEGARNGWCAKSPAKAGEPSPCKATWRRGPTHNASSRRRKKPSAAWMCS